MSSREQSPEIVVHENALLSTPDHAPYNGKASTAKSYNSSAARADSNSASHHADPENDAASAKDFTTPNGKTGSATSLNASVKSDSQQLPLPTVSQLRASASLNRPSASQNRLSASNGTATTASEARASTAGTATPSQSRISGAAARSSALNASTVSATAGRPPAVPPLPLQTQPPQSAVTVMRTPAKAPSASLPRATASFNGTRRTGGGSKNFMPKVSTTAPNYAAYVPDVAKYLKEVVRRRDEAAAFKLLPSAQLLEQTVLMEQCAHEQIMQQQTLAFMQILHKKKEAEAKMKEQQTTKENKAKMEEQKQQHKEEMAQQKASVAESNKEMEAEIKEKLKLVVSLQPRLGIVQAVMAQVQDPASDCALLGDLMQEDKQLQKALKSDARYNKSKTADVDGGATSYWFKQCVCASFNIAAMVKGETCRASLVDVNLPTKVAADKKVVAVKDEKGTVVVWAHTRSGPDTNALAQAFVEAKPVVAELPESAYKGVLWPKDEAVEVLKAAKSAKGTTSAIAPEVITILSYKEVGSFELPKKDVVAAGEAAA